MNLPAEPERVPGETPTSPPPDRKKLDEIFGDVLPDTTSDERGSSSGYSEQWYRDNRPPHHG